MDTNTSNGGEIMRKKVLEALIASIRNDRSVTWFADEIKKKKNELVDFIYRATLVDESLWFGIKPYFVGSENVIRIISKSTELNTKKQLLPVQFFSSTKMTIPYRYVAPEFVLSGRNGEIEAKKLLNERYAGKFKGFESGKICWDILPVFGVTPDLILARRKSCKELATINLDNPHILGVAEVKTTTLSETRDYVGNSAREWIKATRSGGQQSEFCFNSKSKRENFFKNRPHYTSESDFDVLKTKFLNVSWKVCYGEGEYSELQGNNVLIKPFSGKVGRQLFAEMLTIAPFVSHETVFGQIMLINLNPDQSFDSCIFATVKLPKRLLLRTREKIVTEFYNLFYSDLCFDS